jgi:hypothetical protein
MESEVKLGGKIEIAVESDEGKEDELDGGDGKEVWDCGVMRVTLVFKWKRNSCLSF